MADDKKLENLQEEIKLLKGELKNSLSSVRDYLLNMELPSSEFSTILAALSGDGNQKVTMDSNVSNVKSPDLDSNEIEEASQDEADEAVKDEQEQPSEDEDLIDIEEPNEEEEISEEKPDENAVNEEESLIPEDALPPEDEVGEIEDISTPDVDDEVTTSEAELPTEEEQPMENDRTTKEVNQAIPKVNMLANLINWVARAKQEIGYEMLPTFLEVYGISGHLSSELREVIIHLAEITKESSDVTTDSEIWSQSMLSLHGILTGGDAPLNLVVPAWIETTDEAQALAEEEIIEIDKSKEKPVKLKLVFPNGNGKNKEFCIDFTPDDDGNGSS